VTTTTGVTTIIDGTINAVVVPSAAQSIDDILREQAKEKLELIKKLSKVMDHVLQL